MEKNLSMGIFSELSENELMETEGGNPFVVGLTLVGVLGVGLYALGSAVNDTRRQTAQIDANRTGQAQTVTLLGYNGPTYTAYPESNYVDPYNPNNW